jgi:outer membrane protein TolC
MFTVRNILFVIVIAVTGVSTGPACEAAPLTVEQCIEIALERNQQRRISKLGVEIAETQLKQALGAYWPQLSLESGFTRLDEDINFIFPQETSSYTISGIVPEPVTAEVTVPTKNIKIMDRDNIISRIKMVYPLYTGGLLKSLERQGTAGVAAAQQAHRRSENQLIYDVKRFYYGALLAGHLAQIGDDALARLETTFELTETLYKAGSQSVNKMDYLRSKVFLESARSIITRMHVNAELSQAALVNTIGYTWDQSIVLAEKEIPFAPVDMDLGAMVAEGYQFNPDWKQLAAAIEAFDANVVGPILEESSNLPDLRIMVITDHLTPIRTRTHAKGLVPFAVCDFPAGPVTSRRGFSEGSAAGTGLVVKPGHILMERFIKGGFL